MTPQEKQALKKLFVATSAYYGHVLDDSALQLYVADLDDLYFCDVQQAMMDLRRDPKTRRCPLPADIRQRIQPAPSDRNLATQAAARILEAISRVGPHRIEDAKNFIGSLGWMIVKMQGGWEAICERTGVDSPTAVCQAQWIKLGESVLEQARAGTLNERPELPKPMAKGKAGMASLGDVVKGIEDKR